MREEPSLEFLDAIDGTTTAVRKAPQSFLREVRWRGYDLLIGVFPPIAARLLVHFVSPLSISRLPQWAWLPINLMGFAWMLGYPLVVARHRKARAPDLPGPRAVINELLYAFLGVAAIMATMMVVFSIIATLLGESALPMPPFEPVFRSPDRFRSLAIMILAVTIGPVAEEMFFRGMLYNAFRQHFPVIVAAILQGAVFGLLHPFDLTSSAAVAVIGIALALIYEWRKTLLAPIFLHILQNALAISILLWTISASPNLPVLGVYGEAHQGGCIIKDIGPGSAADAAGLRVGDVVSAIDNKKVKNLQSIQLILRRKQIGDSVQVDFLRNGEFRRVEAVLKARTK